ncbi:hypothetical protein HDU87_005921 [Geranomyces variabilis]|uniref:PI3K/PI4K catalytic domain-containing protein n=1 Tax=Geranomyces variabilis TaxID=109894 RepID=A0AAD5XQK7_9FUNG|nr:hypothetical protein HDU87_005921 [Geranomyces variabilis]
MAAPPQRLPAGVPREPRDVVPTVRVTRGQSLNSPAAPTAPVFDHDRPAKVLPPAVRKARAYMSLFREEEANPGSEDLEKLAVKICTQVLSAAADPNHAHMALTNLPVVVELMQRFPSALTTFKAMVPQVDSAFFMAYLPDLLNFDNDGGQNLTRRIWGKGPLTFSFLLKKLYADYPCEVYMAIRTRLEPQPLPRDTLSGSHKLLLEEIVSRDRLHSWEVILDAFQWLCEPKELFAEFIDGLQRMIESNWSNTVKQNRISAWCIRFDRLIFSQSSAGRGDLHQRFADTYRQDIQSILGRNGANLKWSFASASNSLVRLRAILRLVETPYRASSPMTDYTHELDQYSGDRVPQARQFPIPGTANPTQYLRSFAPNVTVFDSMRKPKKITMFDMNNNSYSFMFKAGEDLRMDQLMVRVLHCMQQTVDYDQNCAKYELQFSGHQPSVYAMSPFYGLVEFIDSKTLRQIVEEAPGGSAESEAADSNWLAWYRRLRGADDAQKAARLWATSDEQLQARWQRAHLLAINYDLCLNRGMGIPMPELVPIRYAKSNARPNCEEDHG